MADSPKPRRHQGWPSVPCGSVFILEEQHILMRVFRFQLHSECADSEPVPAIACPVIPFGHLSVSGPIFVLVFDP